MRKIVVIMITGLLLFTLAACSGAKEKTAFDLIRESPAAKLELPDGKSAYVDGEIALLRSFADLQLRESTLEPADEEGDWLYRIVFNPAEKVKGLEEIAVSFHRDYVQIGEEFYLGEEGVAYDSILDWTKSKFDYFADYLQ
ncbi:MAG: hypothetical protein J5865_03310 [Lachnospiraceae bacterium]|nr:hypothetical protein [Lachnospiraceae bacterium]